jgi:phosphonate transport system substrate-binding protein
MKMLERRSKSSTDSYLLFSGRRVCSNSFHTILIGVTLSILLILYSCSDDRPTVDFEGGADREVSSTAVNTDHRATLRVAVGAMLSPEITREYYQDLLKLIAARVDRRAIFSQRRTYAEINEMVKEHEVDIAFVCSGPYTKGRQDFGMEILVVPMVNKQRVYHSYIIAHHDSDIKSFDDLRGRRFAFTDPNSNTGYLVPNYMLVRRGETSESYF